MFQLSFDLYTTYLGTTDISVDGMYITDYIADIDIPTSGMKVPKYYQTDYKNVKYGTGTISTSGCAPTCIAMIVSYFKKIVI